MSNNNVASSTMIAAISAPFLLAAIYSRQSTLSKKLSESSALTTVQVIDEIEDRDEVAEKEKGSENQEIQSIEHSLLLLTETEMCGSLEETKMMDSKSGNMNGPTTGIMPDAEEEQSQLLLIIQRLEKSLDDTTVQRDNLKFDLKEEQERCIDLRRRCFDLEKENCTLLSSREKIITELAKIKERNNKETSKLICSKDELLQKMKIDYELKINQLEKEKKGEMVLLQDKVVSEVARVKDGKEKEIRNLMASQDELVQKIKLEYDMKITRLEEVVDRQTEAYERKIESLMTTSTTPSNLKSIVKKKNRLSLKGVTKLKNVIL